MKNPVLTIIVPCFNEEDVLSETLKQLTSVLQANIDNNMLSEQSKILFVDDGSSDNTWEMIEEFSEHGGFATGIKFSRNFGHQNALIAGLNVAVKFSDIMITIDADLQDDVKTITRMIVSYTNGNDIVYGVRNNRTTDSFFKRKTAEMFYSFMNKMGVKIIYNHADFRLMSKRAVEGLLKYKERNLFLRGIVPLVGYQSEQVYYARKKRFAGKSKYPISKMIKFAMDGITSFSIAPIRGILYLGVVVITVSLLFMLYAIIQQVSGHTVRGWSSLMISIWFIGGVQLVSLSAIGEYVGKIFAEVKKRPRFEIEKDLFTIMMTKDHKSVD